MTYEVCYMPWQDEAYQLDGSHSGNMAWGATGAGEDGDEGADGWDLVQRPGGGWSTLKAADAGTEGPGMSTFMLPPPPSQPELV